MAGPRASGSTANVDVPIGKLADCGLLLPCFLEGHDVGRQGLKEVQELRLLGAGAANIVGQGPGRLRARRGMGGPGRRQASHPGRRVQGWAVFAGHTGRGPLQSRSGNCPVQGYALM